MAKVAKVKADVNQKGEEMVAKEELNVEAEGTKTSKVSGTKTKNQILKNLAELAGKVSNDGKVVRTTDGKYAIPAGVSEREAARWFEKLADSLEEVTSFNKMFEYRPWDGACATASVLTKLGGFAGVTTFSMFGGANPPKMISVNCGVNETIQVPWGVVEFSSLIPNCTLTLGYGLHPEKGMLFSLNADCPKKYKAEIEGLFRLIEEELQTNSIYRGKAFDGQQMPDFLDLSGVNPEKIVYAAETQMQIEANIWSIFRHADQLRAKGLTRKRAVLATGPYGTGKSELARLTAKVATDAGWTFIMGRPGRDNLGEVMSTARLYQPAVVLFEDLDVVADPNGNSDQLSFILDTFDGLRAKDTEIVAIFTTNHPDKIHRGMMRPGRLDAVIEIGALDTQGIEKLIKVSLPADDISSDVDWTAVGVSMEGYMPAFVKEAATRAIRYAMVRGDGEVEQLTTEDFVLAANGLRPQFDRMNANPEAMERDPLGDAMSRTVTTALNKRFGEED